MLAPLGTAGPLALSSSSVTTTDAEHFAAYLERDLHIRHDSAQQLAAFAYAIAASGEMPLTLRTLEPLANRCVAATHRTLRNALSGTGCETSALIAALIASTPFTGVQAVLASVEMHYIGMTEWTFMSLLALGPGWTVPLDWRRIRQRDEDDLGSAERTTLYELLASLTAAYGTIVPTPRITPPLLACDERFAEMRCLRRIVAETVREYVLAVHDTYWDHNLLHDNPYASRAREAPIRDHFEPLTTGQLPAPKRIDPRVVATGELAVPFVVGGDTRFAITRTVDGGGFTGHRRRQRAIELTELLMRTEQAPMAQALRLDALQLSNDDAWRRAAIVLSLFNAFLSACKRVPAKNGEKGDGDA